jgi:hypothetical protein
MLEEKFCLLDKAESELRITSDSNLVNIFCTNIVKILELNDSTLIDQNLRFKQEYLQTMHDESSAIKAFYTPVMQSRRVEIAYWKEAKKSLFRKILDVSSYLLSSFSLGSYSQSCESR